MIYGELATPPGSKEKENRYEIKLALDKLRTNPALTEPERNDRLRKVMIFGFGIAFFQQATGINAVFYYLPTIFGQSGGELSSAFGQSVFVGLVNVVMTVVAILVYETAGVDLLRRGWINLDLIWSVALIGAGVLTATSTGSPAVGAPPDPPTAAPAPLGLPCATYLGGDTVCSGEVKSFDSSPLDVDVTLPH